MDNQYNLLGVIQTIWKWRKKVLWVGAITFIGACLITFFLLPNYYASSAIFYAASPNLAFPEPVGMESKETEYYGEAEDMDRILTISESNEVADFLINEFKLAERFDINPEAKLADYKIMKKFRKLYTVKKIKDSQKLELATRRLTVKEKENQLKILNDSLSVIRSKFGIYNTLTQSQGFAESIQQNEIKLATSQARKRLYKTKAGARYRDSVLVATADIEGATKGLELLNERLGLFNQGMAIVETLTEVQEEASQQLGQNREREKQLEATINSQFSGLYLVEAPETPIFKSRPSRSILVLAVTFAAVFFSIMGILLLESYRSVNWKEVLRD